MTRFADWFWRWFGAGPTQEEIDNDLAILDEKSDRRTHPSEATMSDPESELQLSPPPGTPDSPRKICVFQLSDCEWWAGESMQACIDKAAGEWGLSDQEKVDFFDEAIELNEQVMEKLQFCYDEDDPTKKHSFRTELDIRLADPKQTFPQFFAGTER